MEVLRYVQNFPFGGIVWTVGVKRLMQRLARKNQRRFFGCRYKVVSPQNRCELTAGVPSAVWCSVLRMLLLAAQPCHGKKRTNAANSPKMTQQPLLMIAVFQSFLRETKSSSMYKIFLSEGRRRDGRRDAGIATSGPKKNQM